MTRRARRDTMVLRGETLVFLGGTLVLVVLPLISGDEARAILPWTAGPDARRTLIPRTFSKRERDREKVY